MCCSPTNAKGKVNTEGTCSVSNAGTYHMGARSVESSCAICCANPLACSWLSHKYKWNESLFQRPYLRSFWTSRHTWYMAVAPPLLSEWVPIRSGSRPVAMAAFLNNCCMSLLCIGSPPSIRKSGRDDSLPRQRSGNCLKTSANAFTGQRTSFVRK